MRLGTLEREIITRLWDAPGPMTVRQIHRDLTSERELAYTTVATSLQRMVSKGFVERQDAGSVHQFTATVTRADFFDDLIAEALDMLDSPAAAMMGFVGHLDDRSRRALQDALDKAPDGPQV